VLAFLVLCLGFLYIPQNLLTFTKGRHIARQVASNNTVPRQVQSTSRHPERIFNTLQSDPDVPNNRLLPAARVDVTDPTSLKAAFRDADVVVSLVGIMHGTPQDFENIQWKGTENVANCAKDVGAKLIHFSAIGADAKSHIPYVRTKGLAEKSVLDILPNATIIRPSLVFGPEDDFFNVRCFLCCTQSQCMHSDSILTTSAFFQTYQGNAILTCIWRRDLTFPTGVCWRYCSSCRSDFKR